MTPLEELRTFNELLKNLIKHDDVSAKITDLDFFRKILEDLKKADGIDTIVITTKDGDVNFDDLFGSEKEKKKNSKSVEDTRKEIAEKVQEALCTKEKEEAKDEYVIRLSFTELKALYKIFFWNFMGVLKSTKLRKALTSVALKIHKAYTDAT